MLYTVLPSEAFIDLIIGANVCREIEMWTERATSTMVKLRGSGARPTPTSAQSRRWVLEYKPVVRHSGWLIKRGHGLRNFKRRLFCIVDNELIYHDTHDATEVRGGLDLTQLPQVRHALAGGLDVPVEDDRGGAQPRAMGGDDPFDPRVDIDVAGCHEFADALAQHLDAGARDGVLEVRLPAPPPRPPARRIDVGRN